MKNVMKTMLLVCTAVFGMVSCEDVPSPYAIPTSGEATGNVLPYTSASCQTNWTTEALNDLNDPWSQGSSYTKASGYSGGSTQESEGLLISPAINTKASGNEVAVSFEYILAYDNSDSQYKNHIKLYVYADNADGSTPEMSSWKELPLTLTPRTGTSWDDFNTENIALDTAYINKENVHFAFWFYCPSSGSTTYEIKNFNVKEGSGGGDTPTPEGNNGTKTEPLTVAQAASASGNGYVGGYIVGYVDGQSLADGAKFEVATDSQTEILIADEATCQDYTQCLPVQLPVGEIRTALNPNQASVIGKKVVLYGSFETYFGTKGMKSTSWASFDGKEIGTDPDAPVTPGTDPKGSGTQSDPWNVAGALAYIQTLSSSDAPETMYYTKGKISNVVRMGDSGSIQFYMSDDGTTSNELLVYFCDNLGQKPFSALTDLSVGDEVVVCGKVKNYKGNTPEYNSGAYLISLNGKTEGGGDTPEPDPQPSGDGMTINDLPSDITTNAYGTQKTADESTWLTWTWNNVEFKGVKICKATAMDGTIQFQGNATDATKQGFIFNSTAWSKNISKITIVLKVLASSTYAPSYSLYAGSTAHSTTTAIEPNSVESTDDSGNKVYTQTFDLSSSNAKYFTIANDKAGVIYVEKIIVE